MVTVLAPAAILAVWGGAYIWSCIQVLSAPGRPVELTYRSKSGTATLHADSYSVDWLRGVAHVDHPDLRGEDGQILASAGRIDASGISIPLRSVDVSIRDLTATITRLPGGKFDVQNYLPAQKGAPSQTPFIVTLNRAEVTLIDKAGSRPFRQDAVARDVDVRGVGDQWMASTDLELPGAGHARVRLVNLPERLYAKASTPGLKLGRILAHLETTPDLGTVAFLKQTRVGTLEVKGPIALLIPKTKALEIEGELTAVGTGVGYKEYTARSAVFTGTFSRKGASGTLRAETAGVKADFEGSMDWRNGVVLGGALHARVASKSSLPGWAKRSVPTAVSFGAASFSGWIGYDAQSAFRAQGQASAEHLVAYGQEVLHPKLSVALNRNSARVGIEDASWAGSPLHGAVLAGLQSPSLTGAITADRVDLAVLAKRLKATGLSGTAQATVLLGGTRSSPTALLQASGRGSYRLDHHAVEGRFQAAANYSGDLLHVERLRVGTDAGAARAVGTIAIRRKSLNLKVDVTSVELQKIRDDLAGTINASGVLKGTLSDPRFVGNALMLGFSTRGQDVPFVSASLSADKNSLTASDLQIVKGTGQAQGDFTLNLHTKAIAGKFSAGNLLLNEYLGDQALGAVSVPQVTVGGTLEEPIASGTAYGKDLELGGIRVDSAEIAASVKGTIAHIDRAVAKVGEGTLNASGTYDYDKRSGLFDLTSSDLALNRITPPGKGAANVTGSIDGAAHVAVNQSGVWSGTSSGALHDVSLNETEFGSGRWKLAYDGSDLTGNASIGKLDRFLLIENVDYNTDSENIEAQVSVLNGALHDLYASTRPFFPSMSPDVRNKLESLEGNLDATVAFAGPVHDPNLDVKLFDIRDLALESKDLGRLSSQFQKSGTLWTVHAFDWTGPQGTLILRPGTLDTRGNLYLDGDLSNFDLKYVGLADPDWAQLQGNASLSFLATGETAKPHIRASLESTKGSEFTVGSSGESFRLNLDTINVSQANYADGGYTGGIQASGKFFYRGLAGDVSAHVPMNYPLEIPDGPEIKVSLTFPEVDVKDLGEYATFLDTERSMGKLTGTIAIVGPKSNLALQGSVAGQADTLAFRGIQTELLATVASVKLQDNQILLSLNSKGSAGGALSTDLTATIPDLRNTMDHIAKGDPQAIMRSPVQGTVTATNLNVRESKNKEYGTYHATVNTKLTVDGPAMRPLIKGRVGISDTNVLLPSVFQGAGPSAEMLFNPRFEIPIELDDVARFRTSLADVALTGGVLLTGSLAEPNLGGTLTLQSGRISLPTSKVNLEEGGTLRPSYSVSSTGDVAARVDVNMEGRTSVTAMRGDTVQRYDIRLDITGDLLSDNGLNLNATSDPPDLSRDEILSLLGQTDVLKGLGSASGVSESETEARIRGALVSIAVPQLTQGITSQLATNLGLEYLNVEYNPIEGASLDFAKVLGKGLVLQGRRQISPTIGTRKLDYDLRLTYRLPTRNAALSRVVFSAGLDQDRPWKVGIEYGFRF